MVAFVETTVILYSVIVEGHFAWATFMTMVVLLGQLLATLTACQSTTVALRGKWRAARTAGQKPVKAAKTLGMF